jgi:hypothetical protein
LPCIEVNICPFEKAEFPANTKGVASDKIGYFFQIGFGAGIEAVLLIAQIGNFGFLGAGCRKCIISSTFGL